ncbi:MAG: acetyl-CoA carboxylase carboxyltransferase subunit alpha [Planctomycetota bacterium]
MAQNDGLDFEAPILELERKIAELESFSGLAEVNLSEEIKKLRERANKLKQEIYKNLVPWQRVQIARHPQRPLGTDFINLIFTDFYELYGDRTFRDDKAMITGFARINGHPVMVIANRKGKTTRERLSCNFGSPHPEGYRKAMLKMKLAEKFHRPVICLINTPGAYPGIGAEERGQAWVIAQNIFEMSRLKTPVICVVIGEGGSGGALAIGIGDKLAILENAYFSVISPEGCAAILWRDGSKAPEAAKVLKLTAHDLLKLGIVDEIIPEPLGGAHRDSQWTANVLKQTLLRYLEELKSVPLATLLEQRYEKYRRIGQFLEGPLEAIKSERGSGNI